MGIHGHNITVPVVVSKGIGESHHASFEFGVSPLLAFSHKGLACPLLFGHLVSSRCFFLVFGELEFGLALADKLGSPLWFLRSIIL